MFQSRNTFYQKNLSRTKRGLKKWDSYILSQAHLSEAHTRQENCSSKTSLVDDNSLGDINKRRKLDSTIACKIQNMHIILPRVSLFSYQKQDPLPFFPMKWP